MCYIRIQDISLALAFGFAHQAAHRSKSNPSTSTLK